LDVAGAGLALVMLAPLLLLVALAVAVALGRPVLFRQERAGRGGVPFTLIKFRSMRDGPGEDAERLTSFGRALRATALDELPQLVNVLRGEMSLVGPRPLPMAYTARYSPAAAVAPGGTPRPGRRGTGGGTQWRAVGGAAGTGCLLCFRPVRNPGA
jgi:lipopolysaccharide/colanic/teichoic acid biosynthesis glycosyltransferase